MKRHQRSNQIVIMDTYQRDNALHMLHTKSGRSGMYVMIRYKPEISLYSLI